MESDKILYQKEFGWYQSFKVILGDDFFEVYENSPLTEEYRESFQSLQAAIDWIEKQESKEV